MKKALCVVVLLGAMAASAEDSYLYWMVGSDAGDYSYARIRDDSGNYLSIYDSGFDSEYVDVGDKSSISKANVDDLRTYNEGLYAALATSPVSSFVVELYNADNKFVSQAVLPYSEGSIYTGGIAAPAASWATFQSFAVPEPSSGLLMLIGCAMLGLRRRRQKVA